MSVNPFEQFPKLNIFKSSGQKSSSAETLQPVDLHDYTGKDCMSKCIQFIPVPLCLIDTRGNVLSSNKEFNRCIYGNSTEKISSILESISSIDLDRFYNTILDVIAANEPEIKNIEKCLTVTHNDDGIKSQVYFDWSLSASGTGSDFIVVSARVSSLYTFNRSFKKVSSSRQEYKRASSDRQLFASSSVMSLANKSISSSTQMMAETVEYNTSQLKEERRKSAILQNALDTKSSFVRSVSHEIRTPLSVVLSGLTYIHGAESMSVENRSYLQDIITSCQVAIDILNELLLYEKLEGGQFKPDRAVCDLVPHVMGVYKQFCIQSRAENISLSCEGDLNVVILADIDAYKISQVLRNLVSNALKFTPAGGSVSISLKLLPGAERVRIEVKDSGPGISKENQDRLFKEVIQISPNLLQNGQGSGLGLFNSKKVIELHSGDIGVFSEGEGKGSVFFLELPIESVTDKLSSAESCITSVQPNVHLDLSNLHVLIVDDDRVCRRMHMLHLKSVFDVCEEAVDGEDAVDKVRASFERGKPFDVILMDSSMPKMSGLTATQRIREMGFIGKIFGVTGNAFDSDILDFMSNGADVVFAKPLGFEAFQQILQIVREL